MARIDHESGSSLRKALRAMYPLPHYALLYEVASGMGATLNGYADAMAMGLFPSRGLDIEGFEIKTNRRDWLKELKDPAKAEHVAKYCDKWWLVISEEGIAKPEEVPAGWGLYVQTGDKLEIAKRPKRLKAVTPDRAFIGAMLRRANEMAERERQRAIEAIDKDEFVLKATDKAEKEAERRFTDDLEISTREHQSLKLQVDTFEKISGIEINRYNGQRMGEAVKLLMNLKDSHDIEMIARLAVNVSERAANLQEAAEQFKQAGTSFSSLGKLPS